MVIDGGESAVIGGETVANRWLSVVFNDGESMANDGGSTNGRHIARVLQCGPIKTSDPA